MPTISPIAGNALLGIQRGMDGLRENAAEIASADRLNGPAPGQSSDPVRDLAEPLVESRQNARQVEASAKVLEAENQAIGSLLEDLVHAVVDAMQHLLVQLHVHCLHRTSCLLVQCVQQITQTGIVVVDRNSFAWISL